MDDTGGGPPRPGSSSLRARLEARLAALRQRSRARTPVPPPDERAWRRLEESVVPRLEALEVQRREAPALLAELLAWSEPDRFLALAKDSRFASIPLAQLLLAKKARNPLDDTLSRCVLVIAGRLEPEVAGHGLIENLQAAAWARIGDARREARELARAESAFRRAAAHLAEGPEPLEEARLRRFCALLYRDRRDLPRAIRLQERAVHLLSTCAQAQEIACALIELAALRAEADRAAALEAALRDAAVVLGDDPAAAGLSLRRLEDLALRLAASGQGRQADALIDASFRRLVPVLPGGGQAYLQAIAGRAAAQAGRRDLAARAFAVAWPGLLAGGRPEEAAAAYIDLLANLVALGEHTRAHRALGEGMPQLANAGLRKTTRSALNLTQLAVQTGNSYAGLLEELAALLRSALLEEG